MQSNNNLELSDLYSIKKLSFILWNRIITKRGDAKVLARFNGRVTSYLRKLYLQQLWK